MVHLCSALMSPVDVNRAVWSPSGRPTGLDPARSPSHSQKLSPSLSVSPLFHSFLSGMHFPPSCLSHTHTTTLLCPSPLSPLSSLSVFLSLSHFPLSLLSFFESVATRMCIGLKQTHKPGKGEKEIEKCRLSGQQDEVVLY